MNKLTDANRSKIERILKVVFGGGKLLESESGAFIAIKVPTWDEETENSIVTKIKRHFKTEPAFWTNHSSIENAQKSSKNGLWLLIEHSSKKGTPIFSKYILT